MSFSPFLNVLRRTPVMMPALASALVLTACSSFNQATRGMADAITLYKPEVVQGNFVSKEQVEALRPGMTRLQVRDILGTSLLSSVFHQDRWDYVFTIKRQRVEPQEYRLTLYFKDDVLERFEGDEMPSEAEFVQRIGGERKVKVPQLQASEEQLEKFAPNPDAPGSAETAATVNTKTEVTPRPAGTYPPLE